MMQSRLTTRSKDAMIAVASTEASRAKTASFGRRESISGLPSVPYGAVCGAEKLFLGSSIGNVFPLAIQ